LSAIASCRRPRPIRWPRYWALLGARPQKSELIPAAYERCPAHQLAHPKALHPPPVHATAQPAVAAERLDCTANASDGRPSAAKGLPHTVVFCPRELRGALDAGSAPLAALPVPSGDSLTTYDGFRPPRSSPSRLQRPHHCSCDPQRSRGRSPWSRPLPNCHSRTWSLRPRIYEKIRRPIRRAWPCLSKY